MIELAKQLAKVRLLGREVRNARRGQPVKDAKFLFAQAFVAADRLVRVTAAIDAEDLGRLLRAHVWRGEQDVRLFASVSEPFAERCRLFAAEFGKRDIDVALAQFDPHRVLRLRLIACRRCPRSGRGEQPTGWRAMTWSSEAGSCSANAHFRHLSRSPRLGNQRAAAKKVQCTYQGGQRGRHQ